jgi:hypothetical protein
VANIFTNVVIIFGLNWYSAVDIATGYWLDDRGVGVPSPGRVNNFLSSMSSRPVLGFIQPPIQWILGVISPVVKQPVHEGDHSPPASAEVKKMWIYTFTPPYTFREYFTLLLGNCFFLSLAI